MKPLLKTVIVVAALIASPASAQSVKNDIRGFVPGMSFAQAGLVVKDKGHRCVNFSREVIPYGVKCDDVTLWFSTVLEGSPLVFVHMELQTTATHQEIVQSLSEQFSTSPIAKPNAEVDHYRWDLGNDRVLAYFPNMRRVALGDVSLTERDQQEKFRRSRVPVPKL